MTKRLYTNYHLHHRTGEAVSALPVKQLAERVVKGKPQGLFLEDTNSFLRIETNPETPGRSVSLTFTYEDLDIPVLYIELDDLEAAVISLRRVADLVWANPEDAGV